MSDVVQFWAFIAFLALIVWPLAYVVADRKYIVWWLDIGRYQRSKPPEELRQTPPQPMRQTLPWAPK